MYLNFIMYNRKYSLYFSPWQIRQVGRNFFLTVRARHSVRFADDGGDFEVSNESTISALRWKYVFRRSPLQKTIFLRNTSVLGIRALNNVGTWVTYWKRWLYAGGSSSDRSCSVLRLSSSTCRLRLLSALLSLSPLDLLGAYNPTNCRQSHICRIFTLSCDIGLHCQTVILSLILRVYIHTCLCVCMCVWNFDATRYINQKKIWDISAAAQWFIGWQKLYRWNLRGEELSSPLDLSS